MAGEADELERLVVTLMGDASNYDAVLAQAEQDVTETVRNLERETEEVIQHRNRLMDEGARLTTAMATPMERYGQDVARLDEMLREEAISQTTYNRALQAAADALPDAQAAQAAYNATAAKAAALTAAAATPQERYRAELTQLKTLLKDGQISQETYNRTLGRLREQLPAVQAVMARFAADKARGKAITEAAIRPQEAFNNRVKELDYLLKRGYISNRTYQQTLGSMRQQLPGVQEAKRRLNEQMRRGRELTEQLRTPQQAYASRLRDLNGLLHVGAINTRTYAKAVRQLDAEYSIAGKRLTEVGNRIRGVGTMMSVGLTLPIVAMGAAARTQFGNYAQALAGVQAAANPTAAELEKIDQQAMKLSKDLDIPPPQIVESMGELIKAGVSVEETLSKTGRVAVQFAEVGQLSASQAAVVLADSMAIFREEADVTADTMSAAADASSISIQQMVEAFAQAGAVAAASNQNLNDTSAAIGLLGKNAVKGSDAGTSLKTMLLRLMAPETKGQSVIETYGLQLRQLDGQLKQMPELVDELVNKLGGLGQEEQDNALKDLFGQDAIRAAQIFMREGKAGMDAFKMSMQDALTVQEKFTIGLDTPQGKTRSLTASLYRLGIVVGEMIAGPFATFVDWVETGAEAFQDFAKENSLAAGAILTVAAGLAALGPGLIIVGQLVSSIGNITRAVQYLIPLFSVHNAQVAVTVVRYAAMRLAALGIAAAAVYAAAKMALWAAGNDEVVRTLKQLEGMQDRQTKAQNDHTAAMLKEAQELSGQERADFVAKRIKGTEDVIQFAIGQLNNAKEQLAKAEEDKGISGSVSEFFGGQSVATVAAANVKSHEQNLAALEERLKSLQALQKNAPAPADVGVPDELAQAQAENRMAAMERENELKKQGAALTEQLRTPQEAYNDAIAEASKLYEAGAISIEIWHRAADKAKGAYDASSKTALQQYTEELEQQRATFNMTAREIELYKLQQAGATDEELKAAKATAKKLDEMDEAKKLQEESKRALESLLTPQQKLAAEEAKYQQMKDAQLITEEQRLALVEKAKKDLGDGVKVNFKVAGLDAVLAGSAEADRMLVGHRAMMQREMDSGWSSMTNNTAFGRLASGKVKGQIDLKTDGSEKKDEKTHQTNVETLLGTIAGNTKGGAIIFAPAGL